MEMAETSEVEDRSEAASVETNGLKALRRLGSALWLDSGLGFKRSVRA
jgi:hypothetical protein